MPFDSKKARKEQIELARKVIRKGSPDPKTICGVDVGYKGGFSFAAAVILSYPDLKEKEHSIVSVPYIPAFLTYRELPPIMLAVQNLKTDYDLLMVDGNGILHPYRIGIASHLGVVLDKPSIGIAKKLLCGELKGDKVIHKGETIGQKVNKIYISIGHRISLPNAVRITKRCLKSRLPEPIRIADQYSKRYKII